MQFLAFRIRIGKLDNKLSAFVLKATRRDHNHMAGTEEYGLIVAKGLEIVRGMYGRPGIGEYGAMIDLFDHLDLIAYLDGAYRIQWQAIAKCAKFATVDGYVKAILARQDVHHKELAADNGIGQRYIVHHLGLLLAPNPMQTGIAHNRIIAKIAGET